MVLNSISHSIKYPTELIPTLSYSDKSTWLEDDPIPAPDLSSPHAVDMIDSDTEQSFSAKEDGDEP